ncbi:MAG TPA: hypothetical protein PLP29_18500 [Candidatus Ozemobacteraceae bacterium]|nr:hypothetical protein [Candidatus Ozemobacteraceae bacterium]
MRRIWTKGSHRAGYLLEFPLIACAAGILAGIVSPLLPAPWNLVPWGVFVVALAAWFIYDRFFPGWRPRGE